MTRIPLLSAHKVIKILGTAGFQIVSQKGSHIKMKKRTPDATFVTIIPDYDEIPVGTLRSIPAIGNDAGRVLESSLRLLSL